MIRFFKDLNVKHFVDWFIKKNPDSEPFRDAFMVELKKFLKDNPKLVFSVEKLEKIMLRTMVEEVNNIIDGMVITKDIKVKTTKKGDEFYFPEEFFESE